MRGSIIVMAAIAAHAPGRLEATTQGFGTLKAYISQAKVERTMHAVGIGFNGPSEPSFRRPSTAGIGEKSAVGGRKQAVRTRQFVRNRQFAPQCRVF